MSSKVENVRSYFDETQKYLQQNPIIALRTEMIAELLGKLSGKTLLDAGCGNGRLSAAYAKDNKLTLVDISTNMLDEAKQTLSALGLSAEAILCGDIERQAFDTKYDVILLIGVLAHVSDPSKLIAKYSELLTPKGRLLLQYTDSTHWVAKFNAKRNRAKQNSTYKYAINHTSKEEVTKWITAANLVMRETFTYFPVSPLFSLCPKSWRLAWIRYFSKNFLTKKNGSEHLVLLEKK